MKFYFILLVLEVSHLNELEFLLKLEVKRNEGGACFKLCLCPGAFSQNKGGPQLKWILDFCPVLHHGCAWI